MQCSSPAAEGVWSRSKETSWCSPEWTSPGTVGSHHCPSPSTGWDPAALKQVKETEKRDDIYYDFDSDTHFHLKLSMDFPVAQQNSHCTGINILYLTLNFLFTCPKALWELQFQNLEHDYPPNRHQRKNNNKWEIINTVLHWGGDRNLNTWTNKTWTTCMNRYHWSKRYNFYTHTVQFDRRMTSDSWSCNLSPYLPNC